jgi:hypothetical protein
VQNFDWHTHRDRRRESWILELRFWGKKADDLNFAVPEIALFATALQTISIASLLKCLMIQRRNRHPVHTRSPRQRPMRRRKTLAFPLENSVVLLVCGLFMQMM